MGARAMILWSQMTLTGPCPKPRRIQERRGLSMEIGSSLAISAARSSVYLLGCQSLVHISHGGTKRSFAACNSVDPGVVPPPSGGPSDSWKWILGVVVTFVLPFFASKWGPFLKIKNEIDTAVQTVENVADAVEKVAEKVENVAENIAENLPAGQLKNTFLRVEHVADQIDDKAELIGDLIDKVQEVEDNVESALEFATEAKKEVEEVKDEAGEAKKEVEEVKAEVAKLES